MEKQGSGRQRVVGGGWRVEGEQEQEGTEAK